MQTGASPVPTTERYPLRSGLRNGSARQIDDDAAKIVSVCILGEDLECSLGGPGLTDQVLTTSL